MREITRRQALSGTLVGVVTIAGCTGQTEDDETENGGNDTGSNGNETDDDEAELTEDEIVELFGVLLAEEGIEANSVERSDDVLEVDYEATGTTEEDAAIEIQIIGDVYIRAIEAGLTTDRLEATVLDPAEGDELDSFYIETEWAEAYLSEEIDFEEYFERIVETFESTDADEDEELTEDEIVDLFLAALEDSGIGTTSVERTDDELGIRYLATGSGDESLEQEIEVIGDVYLDAVAEGLTIDRLRATRQDPEDGTELSAFTVETEWAEDLLSEEITFDEYTARIVETVESIDGTDEDDAEEEPGADSEEEEPEDDAEETESEEDSEAEDSEDDSEDEAEPEPDSDEGEPEDESEEEEPEDSGAEDDAQEDDAEESDEDAASDANESADDTAEDAATQESNESE